MAGQPQLTAEKPEIDPTNKSGLDNDPQIVKDEDDAEDEDDEDENEEQGDVNADASTAPKKKKKKNKKKKKTTAATDGTVSETSVKAPIASTDINELLKQLALSQPRREGKAPEDYKFWNTQPVPKFEEPKLLQKSKLPDGPIINDEKCKAGITPEPQPMYDGFEWCLINLDDKDELQELYDLLYNHYVEDLEGSFRFKYSPAFLLWALKVPGWKPEWFIGVRATSTSEGKKGQLVAFISGVPARIRVRAQTIEKSIEINFLAVHRRLRQKRLAPVLIKEVTRRCYQNDIFQALYTSGTLLPTPISVCRYYHRSLDWEYLYKVGFSHVAPGSTEKLMKYKYFLESRPLLKGLRPMKSADVPAVLSLLTRYLKRFELSQEFTPEELEHLLCSPASKGVVNSHVVETDGKITDFISYYLLESTVIKTNQAIRAAYLYYYATESAFAKAPSKASNEPSPFVIRLQALVHDALILAKRDNFHVFNALSLQDNPLFLAEQKFEPGDGKLNYYLYNYRTALIPGGIDERMQLDKKKMGGVGVVML